LDHLMTVKWIKSLPENSGWSWLMAQYVSCHCGGIRMIDGICPACGAPPYDTEPKPHPEDPSRLIYPAFAGAEWRVADYVLLHMMEQEWGRAKKIEEEKIALSKVSERAAIVIFYWTYFETRMERLIQIGLDQLSEAESKDLAARYSGVGYHMRELYQILFGVKYREDLIAVGATSIDGHLDQVQKARNRFIHGDPDALTDALVHRVVEKMADEHRAWVDVYNRRVRLRSPVRPDASK
jgi:hypothetical protein